MFKIKADGAGLGELRAKLAELSDAAAAVQAKADESKRPLTTDEKQDLDSIFAAFDETEAEITRRERIEDNAVRAATAQPRKAEAQPVRAAAADADEYPATARRKAPAVVQSAKDRERWGWEGMGTFAQAVVQASANGGRGKLDERLAIRMAVPSSYGSEGIGADGGFVVPPEFRQEILDKVMGEDSLISRTDGLQSSSNQIVIPTDETTPWATSGGIQAYWENEAGLITQSKPALQNTSIRLNKLAVLVGVTEELLSDAPAMDSFLRRKAPVKMDFKINRAILAGTGNGQPLGILNSPSLVTVSKEGSQAADTILFENITKMWGRLYSRCWNSSVWLANQDILQQLLKLNFISTDVTGATAFGGTPVYLPPGGLSGGPYSTLMGRPLIFTEACETLGDLGDLVLVDLTQYMTATKVGGIRAETSMHLWFDYDMMAFRFIMRVAGQPWWSSAITPRAGATNTLSWAVALEARG